MFSVSIHTYLLHGAESFLSRFAASKEIRRISRNPKVHYRTHKRPPPISSLGQPNPVHIPTSYLMEIHPNIIHLSTLRSPQWSLSLRFPRQDPIHPPLLTHTRHIPNPSHSSQFYHPHNIGWGVQIIQLLVMQSPPFLLDSINLAYLFVNPKTSAVRPLMKMKKDATHGYHDSTVWTAVTAPAHQQPTTSTNFPPFKEAKISLPCL